MPKYRTYSVMFEYSSDRGGQRKFTRTVVTVYGDSEFAIKAEIERQYPEFEDVTIVSVEPR